MLELVILNLVLLVLLVWLPERDAAPRPRAVRADVKKRLRAWHAARFRSSSRSAPAPAGLGGRMGTDGAPLFRPVAALGASGLVLAVLVALALGPGGTATASGELAAGAIFELPPLTVVVERNCPADHVAARPIVVEVAAAADAARAPRAPARQHAL